MHDLEKSEFTNMCMIYDDKGRVLVQNRIKSWCGWAFPGGHVEPMELIVDSTIREIKEETNLDIKNLEICGVKQWFYKGNRSVCFLYKTCDFKGDLISTSEGENFWVSLDDIMNHKENFANNFDIMLQVFLRKDVSEHYHIRIDENTSTDILK